MQVFLDVLLPRLVPNVDIRVRSFDGKRNLLGKLEARLRAYRHSLRPDERIMVLIDRDEQDCRALKQSLEDIARRAGLTTRTNPGASGWQVVTRIVIKELEAWYFGDWEAVRAAYPRVSAKVPRQPTYRDPDAIVGPTARTMERFLREAEYFPDGVRKSELARTIAAHMDPSRNTSRSFQVFRDVLREMATA